MWDEQRRADCEDVLEVDSWWVFGEGGVKISFEEFCDRLGATEVKEILLLLNLRMGMLLQLPL